MKTGVMNLSAARDNLRTARRIVVKVGTSTLAHASTGKLNLYRIEHLIRELADLHNAGREIIFVSSGAIATGMDKLGIKVKPDTIPENQALAAIGQGVLMHIYEKFFAEYGQTIAQLLLTKENAVDAHARENSGNALSAILNMGAIPVINENDAVAVDEIRIGDNDNLSAIVAAMVGAQVLIILSDIDGLFNGNPKVDKNAQLIDEVPEINSAVEKLAGGVGTKLGTGGMFTKIQAAKFATTNGVTMLIVNGGTVGNLRRALNGENVGTIFPAKIF